MKIERYLFAILVKKSRHFQNNSIVWTYLYRFLVNTDVHTSIYLYLSQSSRCYSKIPKSQRKSCKSISKWFIIHISFIYPPFCSVILHKTKLFQVSLSLLEVTKDTYTFVNYDYLFTWIYIFLNFQFMFIHTDTCSAFSGVMKFYDQAKSLGWLVGKLTQVRL